MSFSTLICKSLGFLLVNKLSENNFMIFLFEKKAYLEKLKTGNVGNSLFGCVLQGKLQKNALARITAICIWERNKTWFLKKIWKVYRTDLEYDDDRCMVLWHGTKNDNIFSILDNGFRTPNQQQVVHGSMMGPGIYFAIGFPRQPNTPQELVMECFSSAK